MIDSLNSKMCTDVGHEQLVADLASLYNNQHTADVIFIVGKDEAVFYAHKLLLWGRCASFQKYEQQFWRSRSSHGPLTFKYPQYHPHVFAVVLKYIYTGAVALTESVLFVVLSLANKLEVKSLSLACETFVKRAITSSNACHFLSQAEEDAENARNIGVICYEYIMKHACECVKTPGWLTLSKSAVIDLISSEEFCLEEDEVWRAVIRWAKYNADLPSDKEPSQWNAQEKAIISKVLKGVIEHIKFLLIDSEVFAEEVEPSGVVPMELSLERYRTAALPRSVYTDQRLLPRMHLQYFRDSLLLRLDAMHYQRILNDWVHAATPNNNHSTTATANNPSSKQTWTLLYRASRDGYAAADFHRCCDGHAPTYTLVKGGASGNLCGGFSDVAWSSPGGGTQARFLPSHRAFLFTLRNQQDVAPTRFDVSNSKLATIHHADYGPVFGAGADLCVADRCDTGMQSYSNLPHSYGDGGEEKVASCSLLMGDYNFTVHDYEVFTPHKEEEEEE